MGFDELMNDCKSGEQKAQNEFYRLYFPIVYITCKKYLKCHFNSEDLAQDVLLKVINNLDKFTGDKKEQLGSWVRTISKNASIDFIRRRKEPIEYRGDELFKDCDDEMVSSIADEYYNMDGIYLAIDELSDAYKKVFEMYCLYGYTHNDISEELNISVGASKSNLFKARKKIIKYINNNKNKIVL